jgi:predicted secreted hydrolase
MPKPIVSGTTSEFLARDGLTATIQPWEDGLRADAGPGSFEWWYFDAHFDDGSTAVIVFATKPLLERNGPLKPNIALNITRPDGKKLSQFPLFPPVQFTASKETCDVRIGANWTKGDLHIYQVHVETGGMAADLTFTGLVPPWRPGAGKSYFGDLDHYFAWLPSVPYGTVEGTLIYEGQAHAVKGTGYHDHNWGNVGLHEVMDHWYWGRAHVGEYTLIYVEQVGAKAYGYTRMPVFMLTRGDQLLTDDSRPLIMQAADFILHPDGRAYPREVDFHWQNGNDTIHLRLRQPKLIEAVSLLLTFPAWQRFLIRLFANPYYFRFNADLELSINLGDLRTVERGPALFEIMILQGKKHP